MTKPIERSLRRADLELRERIERRKVLREHKAKWDAIPFSGLIRRNIRYQH